MKDLSMIRLASHSFVVHDVDATLTPGDDDVAGWREVR